MSETFLQTENPSPVPDRRRHPRRTIRSLAYVSIGEDNGGIVLNVSESGLALQAVAPLTEGQLAHLRFQLPRSRKRGESSGQVAWTSESGKEVGVQFVGLSDEVRRGISAWVSSDSPWEATVEEVAAEFQAPAQSPDATPAGSSAASAAFTASAAVAGEAAIVKQPVESIRTPAPDATVASRMAPEEAKPATSSAPAPAPTVPVARKMWPISPQPVENIQEPVQPASQEVSTERPRWGAIAAVIGFLAVLSFTAGLITGRGALSHRTASLGSASGAATSTTNPTGSFQAASAAEFSTSSRSSAARENSGSLAPIKQDAGLAPQNLTLKRAPDSARNATGTGEPSPVSIALPESPVSVTASVAIRSRRSIPVPPESQPQSSARVESLQIGSSISLQQPEYPADALAQQVEGAVKLHVIISKDGAIQSIGEVSGPPLLVQAAINAVRDWRYEPTIYAGQPIETEEEITIVFRLPH